MAQKTKQILKSYFETGDIPTQGNYVNLIDSNLNLQETGTQILVGTLSSSFLEVENHITASGNISASGYISASGLTITVSGSLDPDIRFATTTDHDLNVAFEAGSSSISKFQIKVRDEVDRFDISSDTVNPIMSLSGSGYVGIGTTTPGEKLEVVGNISASGTITANEANITGNITASGNISASGTIYANNFQSTGGDVSGISFTDDLVLTGHLTASGNISASGTVFADKVGIGTSSPNEALVVRGASYAANQDGGIAIQAGSEAGSHWQSAFKIKSDGGGNARTAIESTTGAVAGQNLESISISTAGKVGIGTTTSAVPEVLTVVGNISGSGNLKVDGSQVDFANLPTSDPSVAGRLFQSSSFVKISQG
jgi:hypothetical protein